MITSLFPLLHARTHLNHEAGNAYFQCAKWDLQCKTKFLNSLSSFQVKEKLLMVALVI